MPQVKLPVIDRIHPQSDKFATGVETKTTAEPRLNGRSVTLNSLTLSDWPKAYSEFSKSAPMIS